MKHKGICVHLNYGTVIDIEVMRNFKELALKYLQDGDNPLKPYDMPYGVPLDYKVLDREGVYMFMSFNNIRPWLRKDIPKRTKELTFGCVDYGEL